MKLSNLLEYLNPFANSKDNKFEDKEEEAVVKQKLPNAEDVEEQVIDYNTAFYQLDFDIKFQTIKDAILTYRELSVNSEVEDAIDEIVCTAVVDDGDKIVDIDLDAIEEGVLSENIKEKIKDEFNEILKLLNFKRNGANYFRKWYVDGRLWFQIITGDSNEIKKIRPLSPLDIRRVRKENQIFYTYKQDERNKQLQNRYAARQDRTFDEGLLIPEKNIAFVPSGLSHPRDNYYISHLHKAIKPLNQLRLLEDSAVIYRITRAPERRVFYIDVGKLPKAKAEQYLKNLMNKFKSSVVYDVATGKVTQRKNVMTMLEDFYLPTRGDTKGTKVETLQGGTQLGEINDIEYFKKKLLKSLKVPINRFDDDNQPTIDLGKGGELTRVELKFNKFINRLRTDFSILFLELLKTQLILKNVFKLEEWDEIKNEISFVWESDSYFTELKESEILAARLELVTNISTYVGKYYSHMWVRKNILKQTDADMEDIRKEIKDEKKSGEYNGMEEDEEGGGNDWGGGGNNFDKPKSKPKPKEEIDDEKEVEKDAPVKKEKKKDNPVKKEEEK